MTKNEFRAAFRIARLVRGFENSCMSGNLSSLGCRVPDAARIASMDAPVVDRLAVRLPVRRGLGLSWNVGRGAVKGPRGVLPA